MAIFYSYVGLPESMVYAMGLEDFFVKTPPFSSGDFTTFDDQDGRAGPGPLIWLDLVGGWYAYPSEKSWS